MRKFLIVDSENCTACKICELVCSFTRNGEYDPKRSYIKILRNTEMAVHIPVLQVDAPCDGCEKCAQACPMHALKFVEPEAAALVRKNNKIGSFPVPLIGAHKQ